VDPGAGGRVDRDDVPPAGLDQHGLAGDAPPKGVTPVVKVTAKGTVRVPVAGLCCYRPGERSRLIYRT
jgi:hypothetical protein